MIYHEMIQGCIYMRRRPNMQAECDELFNYCKDRLREATTELTGTEWDLSDNESLENFSKLSYCITELKGRLDSVMNSPFYARKTQEISNPANSRKNNRGSY